MTDITKEPCFRSALLWGIATGIGIGFHRFRVTRKVQTACDFALYSFMGVSGVSWVVCRSAKAATQQHQQQILDAMNTAEENRPSAQYFRSEVVPAPSDAPPSSSS